MTTRRALIASAFATPLMPAIARAQTGAWPDRPIRYLIGASAGGVSDIFLRFMDNRLRDKLGQPMVIEPRPGAGGMLATEVTARSTPDGYTFLVNHIASHGIGPTLHARRINFDPLRDVPGVARLARLPNVLIVKGDSPFRTPRDQAEAIRRDPRRGTFSSAGAGTSSHLSGVMFGQKTGVETTHVPYRGTAPAMAAGLNGEVTFAIDNAPASPQQGLAGNLRALGVSTAQRASTMPEIPTLEEQGVPGFDVSSWYGIAAPAGVPRPIVDRLAAELIGCLEDPAIAQRYREFGAEPWPMAPDPFNAFMRDEVAKWAPVVAASGASAD